MGKPSAEDRTNQPVFSLRFVAVAVAVAPLLFWFWCIVTVLWFYLSVCLCVGALSFFVQMKIYHKGNFKSDQNRL